MLMIVFIVDEYNNIIDSFDVGFASLEGAHPSVLESTACVLVVGESVIAYANHTVALP